MRREIEAKFRLESPDALRCELRRRDADCLRDDLEISYILDTPERTLLSDDRGLRVRVARDHAGNAPPRVTVTYKGPRADAGVATPANLKIREEIETAADDGDRLLAIFGRLGFVPHIIFEKRRATWRLGDCTVTVDEMPQLGWFAEIEAPTAEAVVALSAALGLSSETGVRETYVEMAARHGRVTADGARELRFTE
ncbi:MAG: class IV adenylate cyclase [Phycisphaerae bacterium]|nr:class IV adenylate cyclase [Phycisphaerae bacterium]